MTDPTHPWLTKARPLLRHNITGRNSTKKRATILAILTAELLNQPIDWKRRDICAKSTWYDKWQHDTAISDTLTAVRDIITDAQTETAVLAVQQAINIIQLAAPDAATAIVTMLISPNEQIRRLAAESVLDRASAVTAAKAADKPVVNADQLAEIAATAVSELTAWEQETFPTDTN